MNEMDKMLVSNYTHDLFFRFMDHGDASLITESILDDVIQDIEECADEEFNDADIDIAITRVLKNRLGIEE